MTDQFAALRAASAKERAALEAVGRAGGAEEGFEAVAAHQQPLRDLHTFGKEVAELLEAFDERANVTFKTKCFEDDNVLPALFLLASWPANLEWMEPIQRVAYALGVFTDDEIATCDICSGSGRVDSSVNPDGPCCSCQKENGRVISLEAQIRIQEIFPEYEVR